MADGFGINFMPGASGPGKNAQDPTQPSGAPPLQSAIRFLSLRLPKFTGPGGIASPALLNGQGGSGLDPMMLKQLLQQFGGGPPLPAGGGPPTMGGGPPSGGMGAPMGGLSMMGGGMAPMGGPPTPHFVPGGGGGTGGGQPSPKVMLPPPPQPTMGIPTPPTPNVMLPDQPSMPVNYPGGSATPEPHTELAGGGLDVASLLAKLKAGGFNPSY